MSALEMNTQAEIATAREAFRELGVSDFMANDPLFVVGVLSQEVGMLGTIGCTAALSRRASLKEVREHLAVIAAIAIETLEKLAEEKPRIVIP